MKAENTKRDWEEELSKVIGDPLAFQIGYRVRQFKDQTRQFKQDGEQMLFEYVRYELNLLPSRNQVETFNQTVTELDRELAELEKRLITLTGQST